MLTLKIFIALSALGMVESAYRGNLKMFLYWTGALLINISLELK